MQKVFQQIENWKWLKCHPRALVRKGGKYKLEKINLKRDYQDTEGDKIINELGFFEWQLVCY